MYLEKNGHPINSPNLTVTAHISFFCDDASFGGLCPRFVPLLDDGSGNPDLTLNDGIYSGSTLSFFLSWWRTGSISNHCVCFLQTSTRGRKKCSGNLNNTRKFHENFTSSS
ncbi:unnamed protein product [Orchesella dallaii]|uniref:Uncharacterized protein n=1 Tax=Orchesella dallaii TaxID=48710 RepID=A0ABP1RKC2_9HEXA